MSGKIESGQLCTVEPSGDAALLAVGDIVLCKVKGNEYLHLIKAISGGAISGGAIPGRGRSKGAGPGRRFQIGNNRGFINGWVGAGAIFGRCIKIET